MAEKKLYEHIKHIHKPRNPNVIHQEEQEAASFNDRLAVSLTKTVGTVWCAYIFLGIALIGLLGILGVFSPIVALLVAWLSQTCLQLIFLPLLSVGQAVLSRHAELQAEEGYQTTIKSYHDLEQIARHLSKQDEELLKQTELLLKLLHAERGE